MSKVLSFLVTDEFHSRVVTQQKMEQVKTLSDFLRMLVEDSLELLEQTTVGS
jgi:hypothetical protein